jgi:hypothetical protein
MEPFLITIFIEQSSRHGAKVTAAAHGTDGTATVASTSWVKDVGLPLGIALTDIGIPGARGVCSESEAWKLLTDSGYRWRLVGANSNKTAVAYVAAKGG